MENNINEAYIEDEGTISEENFAVDGVVSICAAKEEIGQLRAGDKITILDEETTVLSVTEDTEQEGKVRVIFRTHLPDGEYPVRIVTEVIAPYTFLFSTEEQTEV